MVQGVTVKRSSIIRIATLVLTVAALAGCGSKSTPPAGEAKKGDVLAEVNGTAITSDELKKQIEMLPPQVKAFAGTPEGRRELFDNIIAQQLMVDEAKKEGIENDATFKERLEDIRKRLMVESYVKKTLADKVKIDDAELQKFYEQNKDRFKTGNQIKASHIIVKDENLAKQVKAELDKGGNFEELAKKYSTDGAAAKGGDLGWFAKDAMIPEFYDAAAALKEGQVSGIIKTRFGFHIVKLTGKRGPGILPFAEIKEQLKEMMLPQKQQEYFAKMKQEVKSKAKIVYKDKSLEPAAPAAPPHGAMPPAAAPTQEPPAQKK
jgi:peptidyl-prolyl cis-trans isomerase C